MRAARSFTGNGLLAVLLDHRVKVVDHDIGKHECRHE